MAHTNNSGYVDTQDGRIYYETAGEGAPMVLVHAGFVDSGMWDAQWQAFSQQYALTRFDLLGFGKSDAPQGPVSHRQQLYHLLEQLGINQATLVGCSLGGEMVLDAALERPELVSNLVVVSTVPGGFEMQGEPPAQLLEMFAALEQGELDRAAALQLRLWVDGPSRQEQQVDSAVRQQAAAMNRQMHAKGPWGLAAAAAPDPLDPPAAQRLDQILAPTLIVTGALDDPEILRAAGVMDDAIPSAQQVILPDTAHVPNMEKPAEFNRAVLNFLGGLG